MNKERIIELIKKSKNKEIVLICGSYFVYFDKKGDEIEVDIPKEERKIVWDLIHNDSTFNYIDHNMQTLVELK